MSITIRPFEQRDTEEVAKVNFSSNKLAVVKYMPQTLLVYFPLERFRKEWRDFSHDSHGQTTQVATQGNKIVGFVKYSVRIDPDRAGWMRFDNVYECPYNMLFSSFNLGQIHICHVLPEYTRQNIGSELCLEAIQNIKKSRSSYVIMERDMCDQVAYDFQQNRLRASDIDKSVYRSLSKSNKSPWDIDRLAVRSSLHINTTIEHLTEMLEKNNHKSR